MKLMVHLEENDRGTPIEMANALMKYYLDSVTDEDYMILKKSELAEVVEHVQVFLKHNESRCM